MTVEMYPWHSTALTASLSPDPAIIRQWVLESVRALRAPVFAFGAPWLRILPRLGLPEIDRLDAAVGPMAAESPAGLAQRAHREVTGSEAEFPRAPRHGFCDRPSDSPELGTSRGQAPW